MEWLRSDVFCFKRQMPSYLEEDHLMVMGHRSAERVYYAVMPIPDQLSARPEAYKALKEKFDSFLADPVTSEPYTANEYESLVGRVIGQYKAFVLDTFPDGE